MIVLGFFAQSVQSIMDHSQPTDTIESPHRITPPNLRCDFPPAASTNDVAGRIRDSKKPLKTSCFQELFLVAVTRNTRFLRLVERPIPKLAA
jgi:hypothetical protein